MTPTSAHIQFGSDGATDLDTSLRLSEATHIQCYIYDNRPPAEIKRRVLELMRALRRDNARGQGERTAALLAALLLDTIFESAADLTQRRLSGRDLLEPSRV